MVLPGVKNKNKTTTPKKPTDIPHLLSNPELAALEK